MLNSNGIAVSYGKGNIRQGDIQRSPQKIYYCGNRLNECRCQKCDGRCGPDHGCPCNSCKILTLSNVKHDPTCLKCPDGHEMGLTTNISLWRCSNSDCSNESRINNYGRWRCRTQLCEYTLCSNCYSEKLILYLQTINTSSILSTPNYFLCPMSQEIMKDPVKCSDGYIYDRDSITAWLEDNQTSPITGNILQSTQLLSQPTLQNLIQQFLYQQPKINKTLKRIFELRELLNNCETEIYQAIPSQYFDERFSDTIKNIDIIEEAIQKMNPLQLTKDLLYYESIKNPLVVLDPIINKFIELQIVNHQTLEKEIEKKKLNLLELNQNIQFCEQSTKQTIEEIEQFVIIEIECNKSIQEIEQQQKKLIEKHESITKQYEDAAVLLGLDIENSLKTLKESILDPLKEQKSTLIRDYISISSEITKNDEIINDLILRMNKQRQAECQLLLIQFQEELINLKSQKEIEVEGNEKLLIEYNKSNNNLYKLQKEETKQEIINAIRWAEENSHGYCQPIDVNSIGNMLILYQFSKQIKGIGE